MMKKHILKGLFLGMALSMLVLSPVQAKMSFKKLKDVQFYFSSGAGGWATELNVKKDGSFSGTYFDNDLGSWGEDYPNGTCYFCSFHGKFTEMEKINSYTYLFFIEEMELDHELGEIDYADDMRYVYSEPYGLIDADDLFLYLPEAPLEELPEEFLYWAGYAGRDWEEGDTLSCYGLYNANGEAGFVGYKKEETLEEPIAHQVEIEDGLDLSIALELQEAEEKAQELEDALTSLNLSQQAMNEIAAKLYQVWDGALNQIWQRLGEILDPATMELLTQQELSWIKERDQAAEEVDPFGSLSSFVRQSTLSDWTRERVYQLVEYYGYRTAY